MPDALVLAAALALCVAGLAWIALAMDTHWQQVRGPRPAGRGAVLVLRLLGAAALAASLALCLQVDHGTMAALVWIMSLAAAALTVAFTLSARPGWLKPLLLGLR